MSSAPSNRRKVKIRRRGRHTTLSPAERVVQKAGKAAPALAVVGVLASGAHVNKPAELQQPTVAAAHKVIKAHLAAAVHPGTAAHPGTTARAATTVRAATAAQAAKTVHPATAARRADTADRMYAVVSGDTLSGIAQRFYGRADDWPGLYRANRSKISDPDLIYVGQVLTIPSTPSAAAAGGGSQASGSGSQASGSSQASGGSQNSGGGSGEAASSRAQGGTLSCSGLESLWESAGGAPAAAETAASIAMAESGGSQFATGPAGERGYWQIHPVNGALSTYDAYGNARAAVILSNNGTNWSPWTTFTSGAYAGRC